MQLLQKILFLEGPLDPRGCVSEEQMRERALPNVLRRDARHNKVPSKRGGQSDLFKKVQEGSKILIYVEEKQ